ncbi:MAG: helix-turn-helix transcriptional regulator [Burkholderiaceae bacterium]|nr:helix-turn-helix transcriptional regulator [Burkholderiaceae bacterium]
MSKPHLPQLPENISFASELIKARNELGLTQSQLATESGISLSAVKAYESGRNMPGARELRNLCQAVQVSPNKLLFGRELPFESRSVMNALADTESENDGVARMRATMVLYMLAADEREALLTLAKSLAIARHGEEEVRKQILGADLLTGMMREIMEQTRTATATGRPVDTAAFGQNLENFMDRQGHKPAPEKLPKK